MSPAQPRLTVFVVTTETVPHTSVGAVLGVVIGTVALSTNKFDAGMKLLELGDQIDRDRTLQRNRATAITRMIDQAGEWGANAVVGVRFDHRYVTGAWVEICAYGTAVIVEPD